MKPSSNKLHHETSRRIYNSRIATNSITTHLHEPVGGMLRYFSYGPRNKVAIVNGGMFGDFHDKVHFQNPLRDA